MTDYKAIVVFISIALPVTYIILLGLLWKLADKTSYLEAKIDSYQETTRMRFDKTREMNTKLNYRQEEHDKKIEVLRMKLDKLDEMIEKEKWLTFDSTDPGYHGDLLKALTELKHIKDHEKKLNEEIEEILQTCDQ